MTALPRALQTMPLACPGCGASTARLKRKNTLGICLFVVAFFYYTRIVVTACPGCMRRLLLKRALINLPTTHIAWPLFALVLWIPQLATTFLPGHSRSVRQALAAAAQELEACVAAASPAS
ncbi:MAG: hypothetical protein ACT4PV_05135 [Planctomycetaceae bacterium]